MFASKTNKTWRRFATYIFAIYISLLSPFAAIIGVISPVSAEEPSKDFEINVFELPSNIKVSTDVTIPIELVNNTIETWYSSELNGNPYYSISYQWTRNGAVYTTGSNTPLVEDVGDVTLAPDNVTSDLQELNIIAPSIPGDFVLRIVLVDETNSQVFQQEVIQEFSSVVELYPDTTDPDGALDINNGGINTFLRDVLLDITAKDKDSDVEEVTGVSDYRISYDQNFENVQWNTWAGGDGVQVEYQLQDFYGLHTLYLQIRDSAGNITVVSDEIELVYPDETAPEFTFNINNGELSTTNPILQIEISANDPEIDQYYTSGVDKYRVGDTAQLLGFEWNDYQESITYQISPEIGTETVYLQLVDEAGNFSEILSETINFESTKPVITKNIIDENSSVMIEGSEYAQDEILDISVNASSNLPINQYIVSTDENFDDDEWIDLPDPAQNSEFTISQEIPEETGVYGFYIKVRNEDKESDPSYAEIRYRHYDIDPSMSVSTGDVLYGGEFDVNINLRNDGADDSYNAGIEMILPAGFEFVSPIVCDDNDCYTPEDGLPQRLQVENEGFIEPTYLSTNEEGLEVVRYESFADLLSGENITVEMRLRAGGLDEGYKLGDIVELTLIGELFSRVDFSVPNLTTASTNLELLPFVVDYDNSVNDGESLVEDTIENNIEIQNNPDLNSDEKTVDEETGEEINPLEVFFELDNGVELVEDSIEVLNYLGDFTVSVIRNEGMNLVLQFIFQDVIGVENYDNPIQILFESIISKFDEVDQVYVEHNENFNNSLNAEGNYTDGEDYSCGESGDELCELESKEFSIQKESTIRSKYFKVNKWAIPYEVGTTDIITYYVSIETSKEYNLSGIEITDILPDGVTYLGNITYSEDLMLNLFSQSIDPDTGAQVLTWRANDADGIQAGTKYEFTYQVRADQEYNFKQLNDGDERLFSNDFLKSKITVRGIWSDIELDRLHEGDTRSGVEEDSDGTSNLVDRVNFSSGIKHIYETNFVNAVEAKIGDIYDISANVTFPDTNPTNDFKYRFYPPVGTEIIGDIQINFGGSMSGSTDLQEIEGGYLIDLGKVEANSTMSIDYQIEILDDQNLQNATQIRNLFRADYRNIDDKKLTYRDDVTIYIIEPIVQVSKSHISGYLARGEESTFQVNVVNTGNDTAFGISIRDYIPSNTSLTAEILEITNELYPENIPNYTYFDGSWDIEQFNLLPGESIQFEYNVITNSNVIYGDLLESSTIVTDYSNRSTDDLLEPRTYESQTLESSWAASESLLITNLFIENKTGQPAPIGRGEEFILVGTLDTVSNAPVYSNEISIDLNEVGNVAEIIDINDIDFKLFIDDLEIIDYNLVTNNGIYTFSGIDIYPNESLSIEFNLISKRIIEFGVSSTLELSAIGLNALEENIRKNPCEGYFYECDIPDTDPNDKSILEVQIQKIDNNAPQGSIDFYQEGELVDQVNNNQVDIKYLASDETEIVGVRFSADGEVWSKDSDLNTIDPEVRELLDLDESWNEWDGESFESSSIFLEEDGIHKRFAEVIDLYGNRSIIQGSVLLDTLAPSIAVVTISPHENDFTNPPTTGVYTNYINITAQDDTYEGTSSGIGEYRYTTNGIDWTNWVDFGESNVVSVMNSFEEVTVGEELHVVAQVRDNVGNIYERSSTEIDPFDGEELDQSSLTDSITYIEEFPTASVLINSDDEYTKGARVNLHVDYTDTQAGVDRIRISYSEESVLDEVYFDFPFDGNLRRSLFNANEGGTKTLCIQLIDRALNESNIACDDIIHDNQAPIGIFDLNNGEYETFETEVSTGIIASETLTDGTQGIGNINVRYSTFGENCELYSTDFERLECEESWTEWEDYGARNTWQLENRIGEQTVYIQLKDGLDNISGVLSDTVSYNPYFGTGGIEINNNDLFTNTKYVELGLDVDTSDSDCNDCDPVLMRFYQSENGENPSTPPIVRSLDEYKNYLRSQGVSETQIGDINETTILNIPGTWTYWQEYYEPVQWNLEPGRDFQNPAEPDYGVKTVSVQYKLPTTEEIGVFSDSIIYAPYYGVEYYAVSEGLDEGIYSLDNVPSQVVTQESFQIKLDTTNTGSLTWPAAGDNPVRVTYQWVRTGGELPYGWTEDMVIEELRGNSVNIPNNISWSESTGVLDIRVDTPILPGEYNLVIDTVHEGVAWFSDWGNDSPTYEITINENPEKETPVPEIRSVLGENDGLGGPIPIPYHWESDGWGQDCADTGAYDGLLCYFQGTWEISQNTDYQTVCENYGGYFKYQMYFQGQGMYYFCPSNEAYWDQFIGSNMAVKVIWDWNQRYGLYFNIQGIEPARLTWDSRFRSGDNDPKLFEVINVNRSEDGRPVEFEVQLNYYNAGTQIWKQSNVDLVAVDKPLEEGGVEKASLFYDSDTWKSRSRIEIRNNHSGFGNNTTGPFRFTMSIPDDIPWGTHEQCFVMTNDPFGNWERRETFCMEINVQMTYEEKREYFCPQPHAVYEEKNDESEVIGYIEQDTEFIIKYSEGDWSYIYYPTTGDKGWVINDLECFSESELIENIIPIPEFETTPEPEGDLGYVINFDGVEIKLGPAEIFPTIGYLEYGEQVQVLAEINMDDYKYGGWLLIRKEDGTEGWVPKGTIDHVNDPVDMQMPRPDYYRGHVCATEEINAYAYPGVRDVVVGTLKPDQNVSIIRRWQGWYYVYLNKNGDTGWVESMDGLCDGYIFPRGELMCAGDLGYPYDQEYRISSGYGNRVGGAHLAIDIAAPYNSDVLSIADAGKVTFAGRDGSCSVDNPHWFWGSNAYRGSAYVVKVYYPAKGVTVEYRHLASIDSRISNGASVFDGMIIGKTGNTGCVDPMPSSSNPYGGTHLHLAVFDHSTGRYENPESYWQGGTCDEYFGKKAIEERLARYDDIQGQSDLMTCEKDGENIYYVTVDRIDLSNYDFSKEPDGRYSDSSLDNEREVKDVYIIVNGENAYMVRGYTRDALDRLGGVCNTKVGLPTSEEEIAATSVFGTNGEHQWFENGSIYSHWRGGYATYDVIADKYENSGGTNGVFGFPIGDIYTNSGELCQEYEGGNVCETSEINTNIDEIILQKESQYNNVNSDGEIHDWCGTRVKDYHSIGGNGDSIIMYNPREKKAYLITGGIWWSYYSNNGCSNFGFPTSDEGRTGNVSGWYQKFDKANIYWAENNSKSQPGVVKGSIKNFYEGKGGTWSGYGFPEGFESSATSSCGTYGTHQNFNNGKIYSTDRYGSFYYGYGRTLNYYWSLGEINGTDRAPGWPISNSRSSWGTTYTDFEKGTLDTDVLNNGYNYTGCSQSDARSKDRESSDAPDRFIDVLHEHEDELFESYVRASGTKGNVYPFCTMYAIDYEKVKFRSGGDAENITLVLSQNEYRMLDAFVLRGGIRETFLNENGCERLGLPTSDEKDHGTVGLEGYQTWSQHFQMGRMYYMREKGLLGIGTKRYYASIVDNLDILRELDISNFMSVWEGYEGHPSGHVEAIQGSCGIDGYKLDMTRGAIYSSTRGAYTIGTVIQDDGWTVYDSYATLNKYRSSGEANGSFEWPITDRYIHSRTIDGGTGAYIIKFATYFHRGYLEEANQNIVKDESGWDCNDNKASIRRINDEYLENNTINVNSYISELEALLEEYNELAIRVSMYKALSAVPYDNEATNVMATIVDLRSKIEMWEKGVDFLKGELFLESFVEETKDSIANYKYQSKEINGQMVIWDGIQLAGEIAQAAFENPGDFISGIGKGSLTCITDTVYVVTHMDEMAELIGMLTSDPTLMRDISDIIVYRTSILNDKQKAEAGGQLIGEMICDYATDKGLSKLADLKIIKNSTDLVNKSMVEKLGNLATIIRRAKGKLIPYTDTMRKTLNSNYLKYIKDKTAAVTGTLLHADYRKMNAEEVNRLGRTVSSESGDLADVVLDTKLRYINPDGTLGDIVTIPKRTNGGKPGTVELDKADLINHKISDLKPQKHDPDTGLPLETIDDIKNKYKDQINDYIDAYQESTKHIVEGGVRLDFDDVTIDTYISY